MKISLNWLKKYVNIPSEVSDEELIRLIGARLVEVEGVIDETHKYDNIYVVRVESCEKIPETHLTLCQINVGVTPFRGLPEVTTEDEGVSPVTTDASDPSRGRSNPTLVQVVCGAPNVREGMLAVWIAPGATVPASVNEDAPFVIGKRKMRGYESCGMLAGADELDFGDDHSGIVEIDPELAEPGDLLADVFGLNDLVLEIENKSLTHRPDAFGIIGFAREVAGILGIEFNEHQDVSRLQTQALAIPSIRIMSSDICQRYSAIVMEKHGELKKKYLCWEDTILAKSGMKPISPIVDATNYLMLLTGQPLHAFDYDKFVTVGKTKEPEIKVRLAKKGEKLILLDDTEVVLNENDIVICSADVPVALAGAMGGNSTMIDENTRNIIIESATFSLYNLRKTQMAHGIFSEAITRFTKGQPPYQTLAVAEACAEMLEDGYRVTAVADEYPKPEEDIVVKITTDEINGLLGTEYSAELIKTTLGNVGFWVGFARSGKEILEIQVPVWRTDIHIKEDIIEEVGRLLGYDNIAPTLPLHASGSSEEMFVLKKNVRDTLYRFGANEVLTYGFVSERLLLRANQNKNNSYRITNSISPELQYIRQSLVPSLLEKAYINQKMPVEKFAIFEMNKVYQKCLELTKENVPVEKNHLGLVLAERKNNHTAFYQAKLYLNELFNKLSIELRYTPLNNKNAMSLPFEPKRSADVWTADWDYIGVVGEFRNSVKAAFKLNDYLAGFEIDLEKLLKKVDNKKQVSFEKRELRDLTVITNDSYAELCDKVKKVLDKFGKSARILPGLIYQPEGENKKHITLHLEFIDYSDEVMTELEKL